MNFKANNPIANPRPIVGVVLFAYEKPGIVPAYREEGKGNEGRTSVIREGGPS